MSLAVRGIRQPCRRPRRITRRRLHAQSAFSLPRGLGFPQLRGLFVFVGLLGFPPPPPQRCVASGLAFLMRLVHYLAHRKGSGILDWHMNAKLGLEV